MLHTHYRVRHAVCVSDAVSNFGTSFTIKPVNYFNQLASRTVYDVPISEVTECGAPLQGIVAGSSGTLA